MYLFGENNDLCSTILGTMFNPAPAVSPYLSEDWIYAVVLVILSALAYIRYSYPQRLVRLATAVLRVRVLFQLMREEMVMTHHTALTLFVIFSGSTGTLLYLAAQRFSLPTPEGLGWWMFPIATGAVAAIYLWKIVLVKIIQLLFGGNGGLTAYINYTFVINALLGVIWLPFIVIASVTLPQTAAIFLIIAAGLFVIAWLTRIVQGILFAKHQGVFSVYIILYLCALEILPLAVIAKGVAEVKF